MKNNLNTQSDAASGGGKSDLEMVKVQVAACAKCGHNIKIAATETKFDRSTTREFAKLMESGFIVKSSTLEEARSAPMYCDNYPKCQST